MKKIILLLCIFLLIAAESYALSFGINVTNDPNVPAISPYATVTILEQDSNAPNNIDDTNIFDFEIDANDALNTGGLQPNFGIQSFAFNSDIVLLASYFALPTGWSVSLSNNNVSIFGDFDAQTSGTGSTRQDPLNFSLTIPFAVASDASETDFVNENLDDYAFALHIVDIGPYPNNVTSAWFGDGDGGGGGGGGDPVPEPGTMLLLGFGLIGLAGVARKKKFQ